MFSRLLGIALLGVVACTAATEPSLPPSGDAAVSSTPPVVSAPPAKKGRSLPEGNAESPRVALGTKGAVSSQESNASDVGIEILKKGGNAVDAAVAVGFA